MAMIDKDLLLDKIDRLLKLHSYAREDWFANVIHNTVWDAPEIETDSDLISRADAIEAVGKLLVDGQTAKVDGKFVPLHFALMNTLSALPSADAVEAIHDTEWVALSRDEYEDLLASAEAVQGWIPCSERLPEKDELVLVTVWNDVSIAWRNIYGGWESAEDMYGKEDVTAWMPLPKPYKGGDSE